MDSITKALPLVGTVISAAVPAISALTSKTPKMPDIKAPALTPTPSMPVRDDDAARAAALQQVAKKASSHGRDSTNLYEKLG